MPESLGQKSSQTENDTEFNGSRDLTQVVKRNMPGTVKTIRATVNIPYSYFVEIFQAQTGKTDKPTTAQLDSIIKTQEENISKKVMPIINATDPSFVEVSYFYDLPSTPGGTTALASSGPTSLPQLTQLIKPAGLILLAFVSLLMVLMMMKKASSNVAIQNLEKKLAEQAEPTPPLESETGPVGEASSTEGVLEGIEVDEHTLRTRKMAEQVATMVKEDPASAATLIRQWIIKKR
jgi:hypothetical protein